MSLESPKLFLIQMVQKELPLPELHPQSLLDMKYQHIQAMKLLPIIPHLVMISFHQVHNQVEFLGKETPKTH